MEIPRQKIGFDVQLLDLTRRHSPKVLAGLAILTTLALAACGPEEPVAVADAEGTMVGQSAAAKQESWTGTGAYLAGTVAVEQRDMRQAADLLSLALGDDLGNGVLAQKTLVALMSDGRIEDAIKLGHRMQDAGVRSILVSLILMHEQAREGNYEKALKLSRELPDDRLMQVTAPMLGAADERPERHEAQVPVEFLLPHRARNYRQRVAHLVAVLQHQAHQTAKDLARTIFFFDGQKAHFAKAVTRGQMGVEVRKLVVQR